MPELSFAEKMELLAAVLTVISIYGNTQRWIVSWPIGLISVGLSAWVYFQARLFAETGLQAFYFGSGLYGWWKWKYDANQTGAVVPLQVSGRDMVLGFGGTLFLGLALFALISKIPGSSMPLPDVGLTALSLLAQYWLARHYIENWLLWIAINLGSVALYLAKDLRFFAGLYAVLFVLAIWGYWSWRNQMKIRKTA